MSNKVCLMFLKIRTCQNLTYGVKTLVILFCVPLMKEPFPIIILTFHILYLLHTFSQQFEGHFQIILKHANWTVHPLIFLSNEKWTFKCLLVCKFIPLFKFEEKVTFVRVLRQQLALQHMEFNVTFNKYSLSPCYH